MRLKGQTAKQFRGWPYRNKAPIANSSGWFKDQSSIALSNSETNTCFRWVTTPLTPTGTYPGEDEDEDQRGINPLRRAEQIGELGEK